jgi:predicted butyrate kinase (DUF1464 family)
VTLSELEKETQAKRVGLTQAYILAVQLRANVAALVLAKVIDDRFLSGTCTKGEWLNDLIDDLGKALEELGIRPAVTLMEGLTKAKPAKD